MESEKITNLEILAEITFKIELELNRVKDWIKTQLSADTGLNGCKNNFQTGVNNQNQNLINLYNYDENGDILSNTQKMPRFTNPVVISTASLANQNSSIIIESQNLETYESDDEIERIEDTRNYVPGVILSHLLLDNTSRNSAEIEEIDPLSTTTIKIENDEEHPEIISTGTESQKKIKRKKNTDILRRIKSEQILESAKIWAKKSKNLTKGKGQQKEASSYICPVCSKEFYKWSYFKRHIDIHSTTKKFECEFCSKLFRTKNCLSNHISRIHRSERNDLKFKCKCGLSFKNEPALENHKNVAHIGLECKYCNSVFYRRNKLFFHIQNTHLICATSGCEKTFLSQDALRLHKRKNHQSNRRNLSKS